MNTDIGLGLEKWMAVHRPYEWINEDLRKAVAKNILNEWKWGKEDWTTRIDTKEVDEAADAVWHTNYEEEPVVSDSLLVKELKAINA